MYRIKQLSYSKLSILLRQDRKIFHTHDLGILWSITNRNTLYTTIKRYVKKGILIPIHKGFYAAVEIDKLDPVELGIGYLHQYAYLSTESVLAKEGIIAQDIDYITLISSVSRKFKIAHHSYLVRQMKESFLYQSIGIAPKNGYQAATKERAVADLLYFNPHYHLDGKQLIDWEKVSFIQKEVGFK